MSGLVVGQTYTREEINALIGAPSECECRIVYDGHECEGESMSGEVRVYDTIEEMYEDAAVEKVRARDAMTPEQLSLCDGEEHWAVSVESQGAFEAPIIIVSHIRSRSQFLSSQLKYADGWGEENESFDEVSDLMDRYYGEGGCVSYGYLPSESWDSWYDVDSPDLHDKHATILMEITKEEFEEFRAVRQQPLAVRDSDILRPIILRWIEEVAQ